MPRQPRNQSKRFRRALRETHIKNLDELHEFLAKITVYYAGESDSANEIALKAESLCNMVVLLRESIETEILSSM